MNMKMDNSIDPKLEALLDEALTDVAVPDGLADRVFEQTREMLPAGQQRAVIARLGPWSLRNMAAAIVLAATAGILMVGGGIVRDAQEVTQTRQQIAAISGYESPVVAIDTEIEMLSMEIDLALAGGAIMSDDSLYEDINALDEMDSLMYSESVGVIF